MQRKIVKGIFSISILWALWGWLFTETVFANATIIYIVLGLLTTLYITGLFLNIKSIKVNPIVALWIPFVLWRLIAFVRIGNFESATYWLGCFTFLLVASSYSDDIIFPKKIIEISGSIAIAGILVEMLLPSVYNSFILPLFSDFRISRIERWGGSHGGYAGIMCQLDRAACTIMWLEALVFCSMQSGKNKRKYLFFLIIVFVILSGKRMASFVSVFTPLFIWLVAERKMEKQPIAVLVVLSFISLVVLFFLSNLEFFSNIAGFSRIVEAIGDVKTGESLSGSREELNRMAWAGFNNSPIFGVGILNYGGGMGASAHNIYLQVLCEQGIVGFILLIIPIVSCLFYTLKRLKYSNLEKQFILFFSLFSQFVFILCGITENALTDTFLFNFYFLAMALLNIVNNKSRINEY